jgi:hypothetical protein
MGHLPYEATAPAAQVQPTVTVLSWVAAAVWATECRYWPEGPRESNSRHPGCGTGATAAAVAHDGRRCALRVRLARRLGLPLRQRASPPSPCHWLELQGPLVTGSAGPGPSGISSLRVVAASSAASPVAALSSRL